MNKSDELTQTTDQYETVINTTVVESHSQMSDELPSLGYELQGRFRLIEKLGEGGMGVVYKASDIHKEKAKSRNPYIAIKILNPKLAKDHNLVTALERESEKSQELTHPNVINVWDFVWGKEYVFIRMEYLSGITLQQLIARHPHGMPLHQAWPIIRQIGDALAYAHARNIVHSDFKPSNVFVTEEGQVKVLDFGIAARIKSKTDNDATVFDPRVMGGLTVAYASFEMFNGGQADPRDDVYAFGLVVYEMLSGCHPYQKDSAPKVFIEQQRTNKSVVLAPIPSLTRKQWQLLKSTLEILQERRPKNLTDWLQQFEQDIQSPVRNAVIIGLSVTLALAIGGAGWWIKSTENAPFPPPTPGLQPAEAVSQMTMTQTQLQTPPPTAVNESPLPLPLGHEAISANKMLQLKVSKPSYRIGQNLELQFKVTQSGYLRIAYRGADGEIRELFPNPYQPIRVEANKGYQIPPKSAPFKIQVSEPVGRDRIVAVFSPLPLAQVASIIDANSTLANELQTANVTSVSIEYDVMP